ncbi:MAG: hypothetical protein ACRDH6_05575 [Actinomycetota bacterium]
MEPATTLIQYLERLVEDPAEREAFRRDPETALTAAGLSDADKSACLSGDPKRIRTVLGGGDEVAYIIVWPWRALTLPQYLERLVENPAEREVFARDPVAALTAAGLSDSDKEVLLSGDPQRIREALGGGKEAGIYIVWPWRSLEE